MDAYNPWDRIVLHTAVGSSGGRSLPGSAAAHLAPIRCGFGLRRHSEKQGGECFDITPQLIKAWRDEAQQLERLIQAYEQRSGFEFPKPIAISG